MIQYLDSFYQASNKFYTNFFPFLSTDYLLQASSMSPRLLFIEPKLVFLVRGALPLFSCSNWWFSPLSSTNDDQNCDSWLIKGLFIFFLQRKQVAKIVTKVRNTPENENNIAVMNSCSYFDHLIGTISFLDLSSETAPCLLGG